MYRKSAVPYERLFSSAGYIVNKMRSSFESNCYAHVGLLALLVIRRHLSQKTLVLFTVFNRILGKISHITNMIFADT